MALKGICRIFIVSYGVRFALQLIAGTVRATNHRWSERLEDKMAVLLIRVISILYLTRFIYAHSCQVRDVKVKSDLDLVRVSSL